MATQQISMLTDAVVVMVSGSTTTTTTKPSEINMFPLLPAEILEMILFLSWNPNQRLRLYSPYAIVCKQVCKRWWALIQDWIDMCLQRDIKFQPDLAWQHAHTAITLAAQGLLDGHLELTKWVMERKASILTSKVVNLENMSWAAELGKHRNRINQISGLRKLWMDCMVRAALQSEHYKNNPEPLLEWLWPNNDKGESSSAGWEWMPQIHINDLELPLLWSHDAIAVWILKRLCKQATRNTTTETTNSEYSLTFFGTLLERKKEFPLEIINQVVETLSYGPGFSRRDRGRCLLADRVVVDISNSGNVDDDIDFCHRIIARLAGLFLSKGMIKSCDFVLRGLADPEYGLELVFCYPKLLQFICMHGAVEPAIWLANHVAMMASSRGSKHPVSHCLHGAVMSHNYLLKDRRQSRTVKITGSYEDTSKLLLKYIIPALHGGSTNKLPRIEPVTPSLLQKISEIWPLKKAEQKEQPDKPDKPSGGPRKWWHQFFGENTLDVNPSGAVGLSNQGFIHRGRNPRMNFGPRRQRIVLPRRPYTYNSSNKRMYAPTPATNTGQQFAYAADPSVIASYNDYLISEQLTDHRPIYPIRKQREEKEEERNRPSPKQMKYALVKGDQLHYISVYKQAELEHLFQESEMYYDDHAYVSWCLVGLVRTFNLNLKQITQRRQAARLIIESGIPNNFYVIGILMERCDLKGLQWLAETMDDCYYQPKEEEEEEEEGTMNPTFAETMLWSYFSTTHVMRLPDPTEALFSNRDNEMLQWLMFKVKMFWKPRLNHMKTVDNDHMAPMMRHQFHQRYRRNFHRNGPAKARRGYWTDLGFWRPYGRRSEAVVEQEKKQEDTLKIILTDIERKREVREGCSIKKAVMRLGDDEW